MIGAVDWYPERATLRRFGLVCLLATALLGGWIAWRHSLLWLDFTDDTAWSIAIVSWSIAVGSGALALLAPHLLLPLYVGLTSATLPIGMLISNLILLLLYFALLLPVGLVFRALRRDPLRRSQRPRADSCWLVRSQPTSPRRYFQQY